MVPTDQTIVVGERQEKMRHGRKKTNLTAIHYKRCLPPLPWSPPPPLFQVFLWTSLDHFCFLLSSRKLASRHIVVSIGA